MNAKRLLAHYAEIAESPDAVVRLRQLVLGLAVRGKLVPQDPADEPAAALLGRISAHRCRLAAAGTTPRARPLPPITPQEMAFTLPAGWAWVRLGDLSSLVTSGSRDWAKHYSTEGAIFVRMGNLSKGHYRLRLENLQRVKPPIDGEGTRTRLEAGDILISITGDVGMLGLVPVGFGEAYINQHIALVRPSPQMAERYLPELFRSPFAQDQFNAPQRGIKNSFRLTDVTEFVVPLPPLPEQRRIVAKVDELMALCDELEAARTGREAARDRLAVASLARLNTPKPETFQADARFTLDALPALTARPDQIKQFRQTILNLAVTGRLTSRDNADEPAVELLHRLQAAQKLGFAQEGLRTRSPVSRLNREAMWFDFPDHWELPIFDDLFVIVSGVTKGQKIAASEAVDVPYLRVANVQRGYLDLSVIKHITVRKADQLRYSLRFGDILMTEGGDWDKLGRAAIWSDAIPGCIHQNHVFRVRPASPEILPEWVVIYVNSRLGRAFFEEASKQTTNLASINMTQLRSCPLPLPPYQEQKRIISVVEDLMALCDELAASLAGADTTRQRLLNALLAEALAPAARNLEAA